MLTRRDTPQLLRAGLEEIFFQNYNNKEITTYFQDITTEVPSDKAAEIYDWLGSTPQLREWLDERAPGGLKEYGFSLTNRDWEASMEVDRNAILDDLYGQIRMRAMSMGIEARKSYDRLLVETAIEANPYCYDGQNFFDTDHVDGASGTQLNYSASSMALSVANAKTVYTTMTQYKTDTGIIAGIMPTHIMVPSCLRFSAQSIFDPTFLVNAIDPTIKQLQGLVKVIVNPYLDNTGGANAAWYLMDLSQGVKPFIFQNRKPLEFVALDKPDSPDAFRRKKYAYGVDARFAFGVGDWRTCYKAKG